MAAVARVNEDQKSGDQKAGDDMALRLGRRDQALNVGHPTLLRHSRIEKLHAGMTVRLAVMHILVAHS